MEEVSLPPGDGGPIELGPGGPTGSDPSDYGKLICHRRPGRPLSRRDLKHPRRPVAGPGPRRRTATRAARAQLLVRAQTAARLAEAEHRRRERGGAQGDLTRTPTVPLRWSSRWTRRTRTHPAPRPRSSSSPVTSPDSGPLAPRPRSARAGRSGAAGRAGAGRSGPAGAAAGDRGGGATQQHQTQVQQHQQANEQSSQQHQEGGAKVEDATSQLAGIATLETLLGWLVRFHRPGAPVPVSVAGPARSTPSGR